MERALQDRLRASLSEVLGSVYNRPAVDWNERKSNDKSAFPAIVLSTVSPGQTYSQDGPDELAVPRIRLEIFDLTALSVKASKAAAKAVMETPAQYGGIEFSRSRLAFERDSDPDDLPGGMKVFRTILDFFVPNSPL